MANKIYIAGPMTGIEFFNFPAFDAAAHEYRKRGYEVFSPAEHDRSLLGKPKDWMPQIKDCNGAWVNWNMPNAPSLREMLGADLEFICTEATAIHMLKGWERSLGARAEHATASCLRLKMFYEGD